MKTRKLLTAVIAILAFAVTNIQAQTLPSYVPTNGLVGYWGFNGNANDQSGNGNNGTVNGATLTTDRFGNANSAYSFDGFSNFVRIYNSSTLNNPTISISGWFNTNNLSYDDYLGAKGIVGKWWQTPSVCEDNYNAYLVYLNKPTNQDNTFLGGATSFYAGNVFYANTIININNWYHFVFIHDSASGGKLYINGNLVNSNNYSGAICNSLNNVIIGSDVENGNFYRFFDGKIDDVAIYNRALTQSEITQLYNSSTSTQNLCTKTIQPYNVNVGDATHEGSTYAWSITPAAPNAVIASNGTNAITIDWTNVSDGSYTLQAIETSITGCVSAAVTATINLAATPIPIAQPQTFCANATVANLVATGTNLQWYAAATGGTALDTTTALNTGTYYVSQTIGTCESIRTAVAVTISPQVTPTFTQIASTCSGSNLTALPATSNNGISGTWSPAINNNVTTTYTFTPDAGQCAATTSQTITITTPKITSAISFVAPPITVAALPNVTIGTQVWTSKNLDVATYRDGTPIPQVDSNLLTNLTTGAWCYFNNDPAKGEVYGKLYNWYAVHDPRGLAPLGWHIPNINEWNTLDSFLGGDNISVSSMKETGIQHWNYSTNATNASQFTALGGGYLSTATGPYFVNLKQTAIWWSSSSEAPDNSWCRSIDNDINSLSKYNLRNTDCLSVRLIKD